MLFLSLVLISNVHFSYSSEQRASALLMAILTGLSVFFTHILGVSCCYFTQREGERVEFPFDLD